KPARQTVTAPPLRAPMPAKPAPAAPAPVETTATAPAPPAVTPAAPPAATVPAAPPAPAPARSRTPDFVVPGAPKEPRQAQSLPDRAQALAAWLEQHKEPTASNLNYWLYEHAYIVAGAKFGWWHGVEALQTLIAVDQRAEVLWGVGKQSQEAARKALVEVAGRTR